MSAAASTSGLPLCSIAELPDNPIVLKRMIEELVEALKRRDHDLQYAQARLDQLLRRLYGSRAERLDPSQLSLFTETLDDAVASANPADANSTAAATEDAARPGRHQHGRHRPPAHLERRRQVHELTEAERLCPCCGQDRQVIGEDVTEQYDLIPQSIHVIAHVRLKYACPRCEPQRRQQRQQPAEVPSEPSAATPETATETTAATAVVPEPVELAVAAGEAATISEPAASAEPAPTAPRSLPSTLAIAPLPRTGLPRCLAAPGLLAYVLLSKFGDHLPLYRLEQIFARQGVPLSRSTLCDWLQSAAAVVTPLYDLLLKDVLLSLVVQTDDTPVPVQHGSRADADDNRDGRLWVYGGDVAHPHLVYSYSPNREQSWPLAILKDYTGFLQADGYTGYDQLFCTGKILEVGCWAHARRNFFEAQTTDPTRSLYVLGVVRQLYAIEKRLRQEKNRLGLSEEEYWALRLRWRQDQSVPLLTSLGHWLQEERQRVLPRSPIGEAITYALNQWQALQRYTTRGFLEIDNNAAEQALRGIAVGRKNYLFFGSDTGGKTAAVCYSLVQSCKRLGIEPWRYLRDVLKRVPTCSADQLGELLPARWAAAQREAAEAAVADTS